MRITKEPEIRKQEILDIAMRLFQEKGYEKTSISDIAKTVGVAQGLCYRYFPSKEALFDCAVDQYAEMQVEALSKTVGSGYVSLKKFIEQMPISVENGDDPYYQAFHGDENKKFHDQLALKICEKLLPIVTKLLENARTNGEIDIEDIDAAAQFCVYGQLGLLQNSGADAEENGKRIRSFLVYALRL